MVRHIYIYIYIYIIRQLKVKMSGDIPLLSCVPLWGRQGERYVVTSPLSAPNHSP